MAEISPNFGREGALGVLTAGGGAALAALFTNPMDVVQTRLKLQNQLLPANAPRSYAGTLNCIQDTLRSEGLLGVQRGLSLSLVREFSKNFFRLGLYDPIMIKIHTGDTLAPVWKHFLAGFTSGGISALVCNPLDLLKSRVQAVGRRGAHDDAAGSGDALQIARRMVAAEGWRSLWRGTGVSVFRSAIGTGSTLATNGWMKDVLASSPVPPGFATDVIASAVAAVALTFTINPPDVVRVRLYNQKVDASGRGLLYAGVLDCALKMFRTEGPLSFFKGLSAAMWRTVPHVILTLTFIGVLRREMRRQEQQRCDFDGSGL
ncbi:mitochondrial carrier domain-containing protein [Pavlovales sp. CCMP2436]|nr:mitochondrial carrier domain-containing protein [Pavlovales sp. CCMP2436]